MSGEGDRPMLTIIEVDVGTPPQLWLQVAGCLEWLVGSAWSSCHPHGRMTAMQRLSDGPPCALTVFCATHRRVVQEAAGMRRLAIPRAAYAVPCVELAAGTGRCAAGTHLVAWPRGDSAPD